MARHKLAAELDIKRILKTLRYLRNAIKFMTTPAERKLLRMQAIFDIVDTRFTPNNKYLGEVNKKNLKDLLEMDEDSSAFDTEEKLMYIKSQRKNCELGTNRHLRLISGIFTARQDKIDEIIAALSQLKSRDDSPDKPKLASFTEHSRDNSLTVIPEVKDSLLLKDGQVEAKFTKL
jgi:hypothetical protein